MMRAQKHHERVEHTLDQRQRDHVAIGDVRDLVAEDRGHFVAIHAAQQAGADSHERMVPAHAGRKCVHLRRIVDRDLRHADAGAFGVMANGREQPLFVRAAWLFDDLRADRHFRQHLRQRERNERAAHAEDRAHDEHALQIHAGVAVGPAVDTEQRNDDAEDQHDRKVGTEEEDYAQHKVPFQVSGYGGNLGEIWPLQERKDIAKDTKDDNMI